ncbi:XRE family transcriptional regulator [Nocardia sp. NPDC004722]
MIANQIDAIRAMIRDYPDFAPDDPLAKVRVAAALAIVNQAAELRVTRSELATLLGTAPTNLSHLMMGRLGKYTVEWLLRTANSTGLRIEFAFTSDPEQTEALRRWRRAQLDD